MDDNDTIPIEVKEVLTKDITNIIKSIKKQKRKLSKEIKKYGNLKDNLQNE